MQTRSLLPLALVAAALAGGCAGRAAPATPAPAADGRSATAGPPALQAITESDIRRDMFTMASDHFRGREAGTLDELKASMWLADQARAAGLEPAGDDGTFFQFWPMRRTKTAEGSAVVLAHDTLRHMMTLGSDAVVMQPVDVTGTWPIVFVGHGTEEDLKGVDLTGKAAAAIVQPPARPVPGDVSLRGYRYASAAIRGTSQALLRHGAAAVIVVSDAAADSGWDYLGSASMRGRYGLDTGTVAHGPLSGPPIIWVRAQSLPLVRANDSLSVALRSESFVFPSVNIVGKVAGTDPALKNEYVVFSSHQDHDGVRFAVNGDSIFNGADDNASTSVAILAAARAFHQHPGKRSALFVWQGAEERGLLGSRWFVLHPTVPITDMVAVLNGDMVGRNNPDSAALLGVQPPHRNSPELVAMALHANDAITHFQLDTTWDRPTHPEGWYFRSDHLSYARMGVPALMFTTLLHPDYHTPMDNPDRIDIAKLTKMARWMYATGWAVAETAKRPALDPAFKLER